MNNQIGKSERDSQNRIIQHFQHNLGYDYLGDWEEETRVYPVEENLLLDFLIKKQGYSASLAKKAIHALMKEVSKSSEDLYESNKAVYKLLRYGVNVREELSQPKESVKLIDWETPTNNHFAIAEEVTVKGKFPKRPDIVIYVNGIAVGVLELKRSKVGISEGIRQNLDNQSNNFIPQFFSCMQLVMAGNDTQGMRYGTIQTPEKYYLKWKEESDLHFDYILDKHLAQICEKGRLLELIHDFVVFDKGTKKLCRPNQYFGIKAAQTNVIEKKGGILWHTQGSGKSLTMVWLTKWIRENVKDSRVLIITDREELDDQIEKLFIGVDEKIYRTTSGRDLLSVLQKKDPWLLCSLVHKFGRKSDEGDFDAYIKELKESIDGNFEALGEIYVFVDECHRTQSGKLHEAMKLFLPDATFIGFTGTPLLKRDKQKSIEIFGPYIGNPYKFDEAVADGVVLDLLYEARDVEQLITNQERIDNWFETKTAGLTDVAKTELKKKWGTMQRVLGSKSRLEKIVQDIIYDFDMFPMLSTGQGNALLVSGSIYQACKYYELFQSAGFKKCAIITSYEPHHGDLKGETTGEDGATDKIEKYEIYTKMLNGKSAEDFEAEVKTKFINEPAQMKLLIVVDKLLTGFDAPSATYLYIDKSMQDHGLFQAICRVNRVDSEDKEFGYIIDYKDLFKSLKRSINDYTSGAFDEYDIDDVKDLLSDRYEVSKERLDTALEAVIALCEPVFPKDEPNFRRFFCGNTEIPQDIKDREEKRLALYKAVSKLVRAYTELANEMQKAGYTEKEAAEIKEQVRYYTELRDMIKQASGDAFDLKRFEPGMRQLMDMYIDAKSSRKISDFENQSLVELIVNVSEPGENYQKKRSQEAVAEQIENNVRRVIIEQSHTNPRYFERMSFLLAELIRMRKEASIAYEEFLRKIKELAEQITAPEKSGSYPSTLDTPAKRSLFDNLDQDVVLALAVDSIIHQNKLDGWKSSPLKERKLNIAINSIIENQERTDELMKIIKVQVEY
ncbi:MAG: HsdR family type I site-specific deoxyribonuclease [Bacteroidetes bacterium]|nr:HsdR family type I site-specific deoxyribonuclease [Bacteroidota bacterium]NOG57763.1 HsdR family type I site-specific deoxyribonuclease [Bacteroidota bacterium]